MHKAAVAALALFVLAPFAATTAVAVRSEVRVACPGTPWMLEGDQTDCRFGSIAHAGDVNRDGFDDVLVGAYNYSNGQTHEGRVQLFLGSASGLSITPAWSAESNQAGALMADKLGGAGDVNGDGYDDVVLGAGAYDDSLVDEGKAFLYLGSAQGLGATPAWTARGGQTGAWFGACVRGAGDVNGDGYADVIVGSWLYDTPTLLDAGRACVYLGSASGLSPTPVWIGLGEDAGGVYGYFANSAGDLNHDGYGDIVIGARRYSGRGISKEGKVYVYYGSPGGPSSTPGWTMVGGIAKGEFGAAVASAGDVNGDGYGDLVVGANRATSPDSAEGRAYVFLGSATGLATTPAWLVEGNQYNAEFGYHLETAGDVNRDGYSDLVVSAVTWTVPGLPGAGRLYLFLGGASGLATVPAWTFDGDQVDSRLGDATSALGDINGDGYSDFGVGGLYHDNAWIDSGRAFAFYGGPDCFPVSVAGAREPRLDLAIEGANPARGEVRIHYALPEPQAVRLGVYDLAGRRLATLVDGDEPAGSRVVTWSGRRADGSRIGGGVYFVRLEGRAGARSVSIAILR